MESFMNNSISIEDNVCSLCHDIIEIYAIGRCDHPICFRCCTRMRCLCEQLYCPICRTDLPRVFFVTIKDKFEKIDPKYFCIYHKVMIFSENEKIQDSYKTLLEHNCKLCRTDKIFLTFQQLKHHMTDKHVLVSCELCLKNLKLFSHERKFYTRRELVDHKNYGDKDDKSYKGHPLCQFCEVRYFDNDELNLHLRKDHYCCHYCESDYIFGVFYNDYSDLKDHFREQHFLCEEAQCAKVLWHNAFKTAIDLKAHIATEHTKNMGKSQVKQLRTLDLDFNYSSRSDGAAGRSRNRNRGDNRRNGEEFTNKRGNRFQNDDGKLRNEGMERGQRKNDDSYYNRKSQRDKEKEMYDLEKAHALAMTLSDIHRNGQVGLIDPYLAQAVKSSQNCEHVSSLQNNEAESISFPKESSDFPHLSSTLNTNVKIETSIDSLKENLKEFKKSNASVPSNLDTLAQKIAIPGSSKFQSSSSKFEAEFPSLAQISNKQKSKKINNNVNQNTAWKATTILKTNNPISSQNISLTSTEKLTKHSSKVNEDFPSLGHIVNFKDNPKFKEAVSSSYRPCFSSGNLEEMNSSNEVKVKEWVTNKKKEDIKIIEPTSNSKFHKLTKKSKVVDNNNDVFKINNENKYLIENIFIKNDLNDNLSNNFPNENCTSLHMLAQKLNSDLYELPHTQPNELKYNKNIMLKNHKLLQNNDDYNLLKSSSLKNISDLKVGLDKKFAIYNSSQDMSRKNGKIVEKLKSNEKYANDSKTLLPNMQEILIENFNMSQNKENLNKSCNIVFSQNNNEISNEVKYENKNNTIVNLSKELSQKDLNGKLSNNNFFPIDAIEMQENIKVSFDTPKSENEQLHLEYMKPSLENLILDYPLISNDAKILTTKKKKHKNIDIIQSEISSMNQNTLNNKAETLESLSKNFLRIDKERNEALFNDTLNSNNLSNSSLNINNKDEKLKKLNIPQLIDEPDNNIKPNKINERNDKDFPTMVNSELPKPPPGFDQVPLLSVTGPPPGFTNYFINKSLPPGFVNITGLNSSN